ncbi:hypothetical protein B0A54_07464 [Friedmanniomyces endolithicus]|uniref:Uncharacterized protein n=1 Tax=Friedmanniomyces endolithicus TaxID=329885 RepID=A0A4U0V1X9_9PEZI|nr:hypothetical protein LTS09_008272 [Friedmanniomyces endolithicus]TKA42621.1 hypothetical protein B0A54_07464 [Friedmanniomyces endolithicus]
MALANVSESDEEYHSLSAHELDHGDDRDAESVAEPPVHPMPSLQGAFEESIMESTEEDESSLSGQLDAETRRQKLLEARQYDDSWTTRWKQKPGARHHPLLKLMAQIVFGMHLLQQGQAKSDEAVVKILQTHVNEVDTFLERTSEDFDLAIADIEERIRHLKLPMEHLEVFNAMLDDKKFRTQLLNGNDNIEKIIDRTAKAMNAALMDVRKGLQAAHELGKYLDSIKESWPRESNGIAEVLGAMRGNEQGWKKYLKDLQAKGTNLGSHLVQLGTVIGEMSKLAAAASRRSAPSQAKSSSRSVRSLPASPGLRSKFARDDVEPVPAIALALLNKPLPKEPDTVAGASRMAAPGFGPVPFAQRYEQPRQAPSPNTRRVSDMPNGTPPRPRTAGAPRDARMSSNGTSDLADFLKHSGPLNSNPPELRAMSVKSDAGLLERRSTRARSQGANELMNIAVTAEAPARSKSHGAAVILTSQSSNRDAKSRPGSRGADKALTSEPAPAVRKDSVVSTGFSRRISHRLKHIRPVEDHHFERKPVSGFPAPPTDSAYSSGTERKQPAPTVRPSTAATPTAITAPPPAAPAAPPPPPPLTTRTTTAPITTTAPAAIDSPRPPSRLGLFPRADEPLTPSAASMRNNDLTSSQRAVTHNNTNNTKGFAPDEFNTISSPASVSNQQPSQPKSSRTMSIRNLFHRRQKSRVPV